MDRVSDVSRVFSTAIDVGCGRGHFAKQLANEDVSDLIGLLYQCDIAEKALVNIIILYASNILLLIVKIILLQMCPNTVLSTIPTRRIVADEEFLPFADNTFDLAISSLRYTYMYM